MELKFNRSFLSIINLILTYVAFSNAVPGPIRYVLVIILLSLGNQLLRSSRLLLILWASFAAPLFISLLVNTTSQRFLPTQLMAIAYLYICIKVARYLLLEAAFLSARITKAFHSTIILLNVLFAYLKVPGFFLLDRGSLRMCSPLIGDPNYTALSLIALFLLFSAHSSSFGRRDFIDSILLLASLVGLLSTGSISMLLATLIGFALTALRYLPNSFGLIGSMISSKATSVKKNLLSLTAVLSILIYLMIKIYSSELFQNLGRLSYFMSNYISLDTLTDSTRLSMATSGRSALLFEGLDLFQSMPFQLKVFGLGTSVYVDSVGRYLHNTFIETLLDGGLILLSILSIISFVSLTIGMCLLRSRQDYIVYALSSAIIISSLSISILYKPILYLGIFGLWYPRSKHLVVSDQATLPNPLA